MASVTKVTNGDVNIDVVESKSPSPFVPVFEFHTTVVMNFISADGFFSAYPSLTTERKALMNPLRIPDGRPTSKTVLCYRKYHDRGYDLSLTPIAWEKEEVKWHACQRSYTCPQTLRSTFDRGCLFTSSRLVCEHDIVEDVITPRCFKDRRAVIWNIGSESCYGDRETLKLFRMWRAAGSEWKE